MKTAKLLLGLVVTLLAAGFLSCTKTNTVTKIDSVLLSRHTLTLAATKDASIFSEDTTGNLNGVPPLYRDNGAGASDILRIGYSDNNVFFTRTLVAFDVSSIPANAIIDSVSLSFTMAKSGNSVGANPVSLYKVTQAWSEGTTDESGCCCVYGYTYCSDPGSTISAGADVTWKSTSNGGTAWTTVGGSFSSTASASNKGGGIPRFSSSGMISDVMSWRANASTNFGWLLKVNEADLSKNGGEMVRYYSREASTFKANRYVSSGSSTTAGADPATKPTLTVIYHY